MSIQVLLLYFQVLLLKKYVREYYVNIKYVLNHTSHNYQMLFKFLSTHIEYLLIFLNNVNEYLSI